MSEQYTGPIDLPDDDRHHCKYRVRLTALRAENEELKEAVTSTLARIDEFLQEGKHWTQAQDNSFLENSLPRISDMLHAALSEKEGDHDRR